MIPDKASPETSAYEFSQGFRTREFEEEDEVGLYTYIACSRTIPVKIHVVGPEASPRIQAKPPLAALRRLLDDVVWVRGANCGAWKVEFDKGRPSPLDPQGPYTAAGPAGGHAVGDLGRYPYSIEAVDTRTGNTVTLDPDLVIKHAYL